MKKKFISTIIALSMICSFIPCIAMAEDIASGFCGDATWTLDSDGILTISGTGRAYVGVLSELPDYTSDIKKIIVESGVTELAIQRLTECNQLTEFEIPDTVTEIDFPSDKFPALTDIIVDENNTVYSSNDGLLLDKSGKALIQYPVGRKATLYTVPEGITTIEEEAFSFSDLTGIIVPASVAEMTGAFGWCYDLTEIEVAEDNPYYCSDGGIVFSNDKTSIVAYPAGKNKKSYTIPETVTVISRSAFAGDDTIETIVIHDEVKRILSYAFADCTALVNIELPSGLEDIGSRMFKNCKSIKSIKLPDGIDTIDLGLFYNCNLLESVNIPYGVTEIEEEAFYGCYALKEITIPNSVNKICEYAFYNCNSLMNLTVPEGIEELGYYTFGGCSDLEEIRIPNSLTMAEGAFKNCYPDDVYYNGTEAEWETLKENSDGESSDGRGVFEYATVHYEPKPIITDTPTVTIENETYTAQVSLKNVLIDSYLVMAVYYDGALVGVESKPLSFETTSEEISLEAENADKAKVFVWNSISDIEPMCAAEVNNFEIE